MADVIHARDDLPQSAAPARNPAYRRAPAQAARDRRDRPRSDIGTLVMRWLTAIAFFVSVFTGVRIAADDPGATVSKWLTPILPQGEVWTWHFFAGLTLFFCASAYIFYMARSGLAPRIALKKVRAFVIPNAGKLRSNALNVVLHWLVYAVVVVLTVTGVFLYFGHGGWIITVHLVAAFTGIAVPYSPEADANIPVGTIIPGVLIIGEYSGDRNDVAGSAHWSDGHWTLIASRDLITGSTYDQPFLPGRDLYIWVAVFDHTQTRHTRHPRPVRLTVEE